jgi:hypothetical protein
VDEERRRADSRQGLRERRAGDAEATSLDPLAKNLPSGTSANPRHSRGLRIGR